MRLYVSNFNIITNNHVEVVREMGAYNPVGIMPGYIDYKVSCELVPIPDEGESTADVLHALNKWIEGREINMVSAVPNKPRCFYCGTINDACSPKCPQCGGEMR